MHTQQCCQFRAGALVVFAGAPTLTFIAQLSRLKSQVRLFDVCDSNSEHPSAAILWFFRSATGLIRFVLPECLIGIPLSWLQSPIYPSPNSHFYIYMDPVRCTGCSSLPVEGSGISEQQEAHNGGGHIAPAAALWRVMENMGVNCMTQTASPAGGGSETFSAGDCSY